MEKFDEFKKLGLAIETKERVVVDRYIYILGYKIDFDDLLECMENVDVDSSGTYLSDRKMVEALKLIDVIESTSSSWGTRQGVNFDEFLKMLRELDDE